jgi:hypothetical protein
LNTKAFSIHAPYRVFYELSISFCTASAVRSIENVDEVMKHLYSTGIDDPMADIDSHAVLNELQNIVVQGAAVSRYFWPSNGAHEARGEQLRQQFHIGDDSPLKSRELRNMIEHFDEKLDHYLSRGVVGHIIPHYFGLEASEVDVPQHFFRAYFIDTDVFEILGKRHEVKPIARELLRLHKLVQEKA